MKILFSAPRYHTNQIPIVSGLQKKGHVVQYFVVQYGATEDHTLTKPIVLKASKTTIVERRKLEQIKTPSEVESIINGHFIPDFKSLEKHFHDFRPDIVICREKTPLTLCVNYLCHQNHVPCILYDQEPIFKMKTCEHTKKTNKSGLYFSGIINRFITKLRRFLNSDERLLARFRETTGYPVVHMTPVKYKIMPESLSENDKSKNSYFIPFVVPNVQYVHHDEAETIKILSVGKFRKYKNFPMFIEAIDLLRDMKLHVTIVGQASSNDEINYMNMIKQLIHDKGLDMMIKIISNVPYKQMSAIYQSHDLFILTTKREYASISVLEALANGLAVISTNYNGTASYIKEGVTGYIFETGNAMDLASKVRLAVNQGIRKMGVAAATSAKIDYSFNAFYKKFMEMIHNEFPGVENV